MVEFVCTPLPIRIALRVAMVTMQFRIAQMCRNCRNLQKIAETLFSHLWGPKKQFGTSAKFSLGCKVGEIRFCGIGYPISVLI